MAPASTLPPCTLLRSSTSQSAIPILRTLPAKNRETVYISCLYPDLFDDHEWVTVYDFSGRAYSSESYAGEIIAAVQEKSGLFDVILDSVDTLFTDIGSVSSTYKLLKTLLASSTRLILHLNTSLTPVALLNALLHPSFSNSLTQIIAHNPILLEHIATEYLIPPDPDSPKWWSVFLPLSTRAYEVEKLVFGSSGDGAGSSTNFVVERVIRDKRKSIQRTMDGWDISKSEYVELNKMESLKFIWTRGETTVPVAAVDPTQNLSFNLNLTESQMQSRSLVPLPYAHEGNPTTQGAATAGAIYYDPDSADDIDDDDPDEDLDL